MKVAKIPKGSLLIWSSRHLAKFCLIGLISAQNFKSQNSAKYHHGWTLPEENGSRPGCSILSRGLSLSSINWSPSVDHHQAEFFSALLHLFGSFLCPHWLLSHLQADSPSHPPLFLLLLFPSLQFLPAVKPHRRMAHQFISESEELRWRQLLWFIFPRMNS